MPWVNVLINALTLVLPWILNAVLIQFVTRVRTVVTARVDSHAIRWDNVLRIVQIAALHLGTNVVRRQYAKQAKIAEPVQVVIHAIH